jgi:hypothetical protein
LFVADRTQYIILSNTKSLYSTVMHGKGITNDRHFVGIWGKADVLCLKRNLLGAVGAIPRGWRLDGLRTSLPALGAAVAFALHGRLRPCFFASPENVLPHLNLWTHFMARLSCPFDESLELCKETHSILDRMGFIAHSLKVVIPVHTIKSSRISGSTS